MIEGSRCPARGRGGGNNVGLDEGILELVKILRVLTLFNPFPNA